MAKTEHITHGESPIDNLFKECFIDFTDNPYANTHRLADVDDKWLYARERFVSKIEEMGITTNDLAEWISFKAFWMIHNEKNVEKYERYERQRNILED